MPVPEIELFWWEGCPSTERALADLRSVLREAGFDPDIVRVREIRTDVDARRAGFVGSPTIMIDGVDVQPTEPAEPLGLTCRVYRRRDGRLSPTPDPEDLREALRRATDHTEARR
jgi:hypothetical protein